MCGGCPHGMHADAIKKLYRYASAKEYSTRIKYPDTREKLMEKRHFLPGATATILRVDT